MPLGFQDARSRRYLGPGKVLGLIAEKTACRAVQSAFYGPPKTPRRLFMGGGKLGIGRFRDPLASWCDGKPAAPVRASGVY